jgi:hypothetical protein
MFALYHLGGVMSMYGIFQTFSAGFPIYYYVAFSMNGFRRRVKNIRGGYAKQIIAEFREKTNAAAPREIQSLWT